MKNALELQNVSKSFKGFEMKDMTFSLPEGCILGLVGKNGAGKSTIANLLTRFYEVNQGEILIDNQNIKDVTMKSLRSLTGSVFSLWGWPVCWSGWAGRR